MKTCRCCGFQTRKLKSLKTCPRCGEASWQMPEPRQPAVPRAMQPPELSDTEPPPDEDPFDA